VYRRYGKRWFDFLVSALGLVIGAPVFLLVALAIRLDSPGPAFFRQERIGRQRQRFVVIKFRTMTDRPRGDRQSQQDEGLFTEHDQRITRVGRVLRRLSLDELPQLMNVLKGEMSLIGPRPILTEQLSALDSNSDERFDVRPGITGLAQVSGRRAVSWPQQLSLDVDYARRVSLALDMKIIFWTIGIVVTGAGIYGSPQDNWRQYIKKSGSS
jgi:lipopolysaccharide/colanic/teichoic acid biosynthesis glycosyltransferase